MHLKRLYIQNYRNIEQAELIMSEKTNCFTGNNGMGKTSILDAIYYLSFCKSAINPIDQQVIMHGRDFMTIQGSYLMQADEQTDICCTTRLHGRKQFRRGAKEYKKFSEHIGLIPLVMIAPFDLELINSGSDERRRFMDMVISQYDREYLAKLIEYNKALQQRNAMLKQETEPDIELMQIWEEIMDSASDTIYKCRERFIRELEPIFMECYRNISNAGEQAGLKYTSHLQSGRLAQQLADNRAKERIVGFTLHGIHKDELEMTLGGYPIKREGSQGQNKSYLVALKLAQYKYLSNTLGGKKPLLLLDDLFDKLDANRVENILRLVSGPDFGQIFITDVNPEHIQSILWGIGQDYKIFTLENGQVL